MASAIQPLALTLVHREGPLPSFDLTSPRLTIVVTGFCGGSDLSAFPGAPGALTAVAGETRTFALSRAEMEALRRALVALHLPRPDVASVVDSSDWGATTDVFGAADGAPFAFAVSQFCSGYCGRDARAFADFARFLVVLAGLDPGEEAWTHLFAAR